MPVRCTKPGTMDHDVRLTLKMPWVRSGEVSRRREGKGRGCGAVAFALGGMIAGCATVSTPPRHTGMPGEVVWLSRCDGCHDAPLPERFDRQGWVATLGRHHRRARLTDEEWEKLLEFLVYRPGTSGGALALSGHGAMSP